MKNGWIQIGPNQWRGPLPCPSKKVPFWTAKEAEREADKINRQNRARSPVPAMAFACRKCGLWHVGRSWKHFLEHSAAEAEYMKTRHVCPHCKKQFGKHATFATHMVSSACAAHVTSKRSK